ncbi:hypothetical protein BJ912DRAFT_1045396 [Pholiota molesta]|nr:hypothetical protein BJ912DRAFT_1045396 [Pholiota molesta]
MRNRRQFIDRFCKFYLPNVIGEVPPKYHPSSTIAAQHPSPLPSNEGCGLAALLDNTNDAIADDGAWIAADDVDVGTGMTRCRHPLNSGQCNDERCDDGQRDDGQHATTGSTRDEQHARQQVARTGSATMGSTTMYNMYDYRQHARRRRTAHDDGQRGQAARDDAQHTRQAAHMSGSMHDGQHATTGSTHDGHLPSNRLRLQWGCNVLQPLRCADA